MIKHLKVILASALIAGTSAQADTISNNAPSPKPSKLNINQLVKVPDKPDYTKEVLVPLREAQAKKAAEEEAARLAEIVRQEQETRELAERQRAVALAQTPGLTGSIGYSLPYGNCVAEPGVNNPGWGNPIDWPVIYSEPAIGETVLFTYNHTGYIVGLWSNGDVEIRHRNWQGISQTRFPRQAFRGYR